MFSSTKALVSIVRIGWSSTRDWTQYFNMVSVTCLHPRNNEYYYMKRNTQIYNKRVWGKPSTLLLLSSDLPHISLSLQLLPKQLLSSSLTAYSNYSAWPLFIVENEEICIPFSPANLSLICSMNSAQQITQIIPWFAAMISAHCWLINF